MNIMEKIQRNYKMNKAERRNYRKLIGFKNQEELEKYFKLTDKIFVNWEKIEFANKRLSEIFQKINNAVSKDIRKENMHLFCAKIDTAYKIMKDNNIIQRLNNQGRNPDDVYYNWMRGYLVCEYFISPIAKLFDADQEDISIIGKDDLSKIETFTRAATADFELHNSKGETIRLEIQAGYTGKNDIKKSKIVEAEKQYKQKHIESYIIHFDLFNGYAAVINITKFSKIPQKNFHKAFENTDVINIPDEWFKWDLMKELPSLSNIVIKYSPKLSASLSQ